MDEQLQLKIAEAIQQLSNGMPQLWQSLCNEVVTRALMGLCVTSILLFVSIILTAWSGRKAQLNDCDAFGVVALIAGVVAFCLAFAVWDCASEMVTPQLELIEMMRPRIVR